MNDRLAALPPIERLGDDELRHEPGRDVELELAIERELADVTPAWPIRRDCSRQFTARHSSGTRSLESIIWLVVHCTQGATARGAASWFANPASRGSAHVVVDGLECYRTLPNGLIPWGAPGANLRGWHLELAGFAEWTRAEWLRRRPMLERGAYKLALHGKRFGIPIRFLKDEELAGGRARGVISHRQCSRVFGGSHTDPGASFPWDVFLGRARDYRKELG